MVLPQFEYLAPKTIGEACNLLLELGSTARVMAGATDLIPPMKDKVISPEYIIDLKKIPGLDYLEYDDREGLKIGALTTLRTIETSPLVKEKNPAVAHAAKVVANQDKGHHCREYLQCVPILRYSPQPSGSGSEDIGTGSQQGPGHSNGRLFPGCQKDFPGAGRNRDRHRDSAAG